MVVLPEGVTEKVYAHRPNEAHISCDDIDCGLSVFTHPDYKHVFVCNCVVHLAKN